MTRYCKPIDLNRVFTEIRPLIQPGQHVIAGGSRGVWAGYTKAGVSVVMWRDSVAKRPGAYAEKFGHLRRYARAYAVQK